MDAPTIERQIDGLLAQYNTGPIRYFAYQDGALDQYKQRLKTFAAPVLLTGRAIRRPTNEQVTVIGDGEMFDLACVFSRTEMRRRFPGVPEGKWVDVRGEIEWAGNRYRIEHVRPTGQVQDTYLMVVVLCKSHSGLPG